MKLHCITEGDFKKPPLLLLHGLLGMSDFWLPFIGKWKSDFFVIAPDLRNHGKSPHHEDFSYDVMVEDLLELFATMKITSAHVVGHSMGGKVGMLLALKYPEFVRSLIVVDIAPVNYKEPDVNIQNIIQLINVFTPQAFFNVTQIQQFFATHHVDTKTVQILLKNLRKNPSTRKYEWKSNANGLVNHIKELLDFPSLNTKTHIPALIVKGAKSTYVKDEHLSVIRSYFPNSQVVELDEADHWVHVDQPELFIDICNQFLLYHADLT